MKVKIVVKDGVVMKYQKTGMRCQTCNTPFTIDQQVEIPVDQYVKQMMETKCPQCGSQELYMGMGLRLSEDRKMRMVGGTLEERLIDWYENGETGLSSSFLAYRLSGMEIFKTHPAHPHDYDDLRRVILLIDRIPEFNETIIEMQNEPGWAKIATRWGEIIEAVLKADPEAISPKDAAGVLKDIYG